MAIVINNREENGIKDGDIMDPVHMLGIVFAVLAGVMIILFFVTDLGKMERERLAKSPLRHESNYSRSIQEDIQNNMEILRLQDR